MKNPVKTISQYIENQFPGIYQEDGQELVLLIQAYYEYLESASDSSVNLLKNAYEIGDIDETFTQFLIHYKEKYLRDFPFNTEVDKRFVVKHIMDFYRTKGSKQSLEILMNMLYSEETEIYYPGQDVLRVSDSKWYRPIYLELTPSSRTTGFQDKQITGAVSGAQAFVEGVITKRVNGKVIDIAYLSDVRGTFETDELITDDGDINGAPRVIGSLTQIEIDTGGSDYKIGDLVDITSDSGKQGKARVTATKSSTGFVEFELVDGGFGFTNNSFTDVYVSTATLFLDNAEEKYIDFEKVRQPIEKVFAISTSDIAQYANVHNDIITGYNGNNELVANGTILAIANTNSNGEIIETASEFGRLTIYLNEGTFANQISMTLKTDVALEVGEVIEEEAEFDVDLVVTAGPGFIDQEEIKIARVGANGSLSTTFAGSGQNDATLIALGYVIPEPRRYYVRIDGVGTGTSGVDTFSWSIDGFTTTEATGVDIDGTNQVLSDNVYINFEDTTGHTLGDQWSATVAPYNLDFGVVGSIVSNTQVVFTDFFGTVYIDDIVVGSNSGTQATITGVNTSAPGARGSVSSQVANNEFIIREIFGEFTANNLIRGTSTRLSAEIESFYLTGAANIYLNDDQSANAVANGAVVDYVESNETQGIIIGQNTSAIGVYGNTAAFYVGYDVETVREELIFPPRDANDEIIEVVARLTAHGGGTGATFDIGYIENSENITLNTDLIGGNNVVGIPYRMVRIDGEGTGIGFVDYVVIDEPGSGYTNGEIVYFDAGGYADGEPLRQASAYLRTDSNGSITSVTVSNPGAGFWETPTISFAQGTSGTGGVLIPSMDYGWGFPKLPDGDLSNLIIDLLTFEDMTIGTIGSLDRINPGAGYSADPFVRVINPLIAGQDRRNFIVGLSNRSGGFRIGERIYQEVDTEGTDGTFFKGRILEANTSTLTIQRTAFNIAFRDDYEIKGEFSGSTANVDFVITDSNSRRIGDNATVLADVVAADGVITQVEVYDSGYGYESNTVVELYNANNGTVATGNALVLQQGVGEGYWTTTSSHLNSEKKIHDNDYYQEYSYDIQTGTSLSRYENVIYNVVHPAGTKLFGTVNKKSIINRQIELAESSIETE